MDIIRTIDDTLEAWERGPDAARWTPDGGKAPAKTYTLVSPTDAGQAFFAPAGTPVEDLVQDVLEGCNGWRALGTIDPAVGLEPGDFEPQLEPLTHANGEPFTITLPSPALPEPRLVHAGWCLECTDGEQGVELFASSEARMEWMDVHKAMTDHDWWRLLSFRDTTVRYTAYEEA